MGVITQKATVRCCMKWHNMMQTDTTPLGKTTKRNHDSINLFMVGKGGWV